MTGEVIKVPFEGAFEDAVAIAVVQPDTLAWAVTLEDGSILHTDLFMGSVLRLLNRKGPDGGPIIMTQMRVTNRFEVKKERSITTEEGDK